MTTTEIEQDRIAFLTEQRKANERMEEIRTEHSKLSDDMDEAHEAMTGARGVRRAELQMTLLALQGQSIVLEREYNSLRQAYGTW